MRASNGFRMRASTRAGTLLLLLAIGLLLAPSSPAGAVRKDRTPPRFAGLKSAVTCIPGPVGGGKPTTYALSWDPATDTRTPTRKIVYEVYQATKPDGEDFSAPTYTTDPGVTSFTTPECRPTRSSTSSSALGTAQATATRTQSSARARTCVTDVLAK